MSDPPRAPTLARALLDAAQALAAVLGGATPEATLAALPSERRPAATDLALSTLRDYGRGDFFLARLLDKPLQAGKPKETRLLRALLLIALHELETRPTFAHTVVDQAVGAVREALGPRVVGLSNALLRNFLRRREALSALAAQDEVATWRHPAWWIAQVRADHPEHWRDILAAGNLHPPMSLRVNSSRPASADFPQQLTAAGIAHRCLDNGALLLDKPLPVSRLPGFAAGECSVQDAGAQRAAPLLDLAPGQRVLDACAAPGGKAAHILETAPVDLLALEAEATRTGRIETNLRRLGLAATVRHADARRPQDWWDGRPFDRILADVPCSGSGVARRHPDAKWLRRAEDIAGFAATQREILEALWPLLAPDGKMLYATCSVFAAENRRQIEAFVARHADARRPPPELPLEPTASHDGFYYALLEKRG